MGNTDGGSIEIAEKTYTGIRKLRNLPTARMEEGTQQEHAPIQPIEDEHGIRERPAFTIRLLGPMVRGYWC